MKGDTQTVIICPGVLLIACCAIAPIATKKEQTMMCLFSLWSFPSPSLWFTVEMLFSICTCIYRSKVRINILTMPLSIEVIDFSFGL